MLGQVIKKEILEKLAEAVVEYDEEMSKEWSQIALDENMDAFENIEFNIGDIVRSGFVKEYIINKIKIRLAKHSPNPAAVVKEAKTLVRTHTLNKASKKNKIFSVNSFSLKMILIVSGSFMR